MSRIAVITCALGLAAAISAPASAQSSMSSPDRIAQVVDSIAAAAVAEGLSPALGLAITKNGRVVRVISHGMADATRGIRADDRTLWYLASTSKSYTGFAVSLLEHEGVIRLDAPITTLLPRVRWHPQAQPERLTLEHFLSHTHHLNDDPVVSSAAFTGAFPESEWPNLIAFAEPTGSTDLSYNNFGYNVAAMVIDAKHAPGWRDFLEQRIYRPVGMNETYARVSGLDQRRFAMPHSLAANGQYATDPFDKRDVTMNSAGGHLATLNDLARWTIVQMDSGRIDGRQVFPAEAVARSHRLIARQTREQSKRFAYFDREGWGAGWDIGSYEGDRMVSRFGGYASTQSRLGFLPARRIGVVAMSTGGLGSSVNDALIALAFDLDAGRPEAMTRVAERLATLRPRLESGRRSVASGDSVRAARQRVPLRHPLGEFAGRYSHPAFGTIEFRLQGPTLHYTWGVLGGEVETYDATKDQLRFVMAGSGTVASFTFPATGPASSVLVQGAAFQRAR